jgi:hypothetical protein
MKISTLALVLGSAMTVAGSGVAVTACSSSSGGTNFNNGDSGGSSGGSGSSSGSSSGGGDGGVDCGTTPMLRPDEAGTIYCGFGAADGGSLTCATGTECCLGGGLGGSMFAPQECATYGATCTNGGGDAASTNEQPIAIECAQISDCTANGKQATACCLQGAKSSTVAGCGYPKYSDGTGIVCEGTGGGAVTACASGEVQVCSAQSDCPAQTTCTAGKWKILQLGFCM